MRKLEIGYNAEFEVREEVINSLVDKNFTIVYLSDLHLTIYSKPLVEKLIATINQLFPSLILLGGDYTDSAKGLNLFEYFLKAVTNDTPTFAIAGNHDYFYGIKKIEKAAVRGGAVWIEKTSAVTDLNGVTVRIDGNSTGEATTSDFNILCLHKPRKLAGFSKKYDLAFAGHLHGGQIVLWQNEKGLYPGRFFYKWNRLKAHQSNCHYFLSKGLGDTLPLRFNCKKDFLYIRIQPKKAITNIDS